MVSDRPMRYFWILCLIALLGWFSAPLPAIAQATSEKSSAELSEQSFQTVADLRHKAFAASQVGDFATAEIYWTQLLDLLPNEAAIWSNRGNSRVGLNKLEDAIADYDKAIELAPNAPDPYLNRGAALEGLGQWEAAILDYNQLLRLDPKDPSAYNNRGNAKTGLGQWQAAISDYDKAIELAPTFALAQINRALGLYQVGQTQEAIRSMRNLVRRYPQFADARAALTAALWDQEQRGEAESNWVAVMGLDSRYQDLNWVRTIRRWPPTMVAALEQFLKL